MVSFYPGPSRVHDKIPRYAKDAFREGILSINHRSGTFMDLAEKTVGLLKKKLAIPDSYTVMFAGSATECWEIIAQSLVENRSHHIYNGAFGQKWFDYTKKLGLGARSYPFGIDELINPNKLKFSGDSSVICITQNETANGTQVQNDHIFAVKNANPDHIVAVDATSSMGGIELKFENADIWFASVQKCFGLPAGLSLLICSPRALALAAKINERDHYNSLLLMQEMAEKWQTSFTPNVMNIYFLMRVMEDARPIAKVHQKTVKRYRQWLSFLQAETKLTHLVRNHDAHSYTVLPIAGEEKMISAIKKKARDNGFLLGEGYGDLKPTTFRIANFPAIRKKEIEGLQRFLKKY